MLAGSLTSRLGRAISWLLLCAVLTAGCSGIFGDDRKSEKAIEIGYITWDEDVAVTYLWQHILEEQGYEVKLTQLQIGGMFQALAEGELDLFYDVWLPTTHASYWKDYENDVEQLAMWCDSASLEWAVPEYVDAGSIADLQGKAEVFEGQIIGIEPGAGLTEVSKEAVLPEYGLRRYTLQTSSTPEMIAELKRAVNAKDPVVVTLWHPHWAYSAFPLRDLKDPKGSLGRNQQLHVVGRTGFAEDFPKVTTWLKNFELSDSQLSSLQKYVLREYVNDKPTGARKWLEGHPDYLNGLGIPPAG